jgi:hypothetical protein
MVEAQRRETSQVHSQIRLRSGQFAETHEFIRSKLVWLEDLSALFVKPSGIGIHLPEVCSRWALRRLPNAIHPVVTVREATSRPTYDGYMDVLKPVEQLGPDAMTIGDLRVLSHPYAVVNDAANVFGELPIYIRRYLARRLIQKYLDLRV